MKLNVAILPGDGVGPEVTAEAEKVLHSVVTLFGHKLDTSIGLIGGSAIDETGTALPEYTLNICRNSDAILFGAVGGPNGILHHQAQDLKTVFWLYVKS